MVQMTLEMPEGALAALRKDPDGFKRELRIAAAVKWYELGEVSQARGAEIAGLSRVEFLRALGRYRVTPFQYESVDELIAEATVDETWVLDTSPFIALAQVGELGLLTSLATTIVVPEQVAAEVLAGPADEAARALGGFRPRPTDVPNEVAAWGLGLGESAAIAAALSLSAVVVLDDRAARRCARAFGLRTLGTLGIVLRARQRGLVPSAGALLEQLRDAGLYLDDALLAAAVTTVGEHWPPA